MRKIGVFGGTFNPIHKGHLHLAEQFFLRLGLDELILIPAKQPTHKDAPQLVPAKQRLDMCRLAAEPLGYQVSDLEICRPSESYTVFTLQDLKGKYPEDTLYLLMGGDMFLTLLDWKCPQEIFSLATLCVAPRSRDQASLQKLWDYAAKIRRWGAESRIEEISFLDISSTQIRRAAQTDTGLENMVPPAVASYIRKNKLYLEEE